MPAKASKPTHGPQIDWIRFRLPWSSAPLLPGGYDLGSFGYRERWTELVTHARTEIEALRPHDAPEAFRRLMQVMRLLDESTGTRHSRNLADPWSLALREHVSSFLHAMLDGRPGSVADRLLTAVLQVDLDLSLLDDALLGRLSHADRAALLQRLLAVNASEADASRLRALLTSVLLSEPDIDRLVQTADRLWLWDHVAAPALLRRLLSEGRAVPHLPELVTRAVLAHDAGEDQQDQRTLLDRWLAWCEGNGHPDLAQAIRHRLFTETLAVPFAREWLRHLSADKDPAAEEAWVIRHVLQHHDRGRALLFLIDWPDLDQAVQHATTHAAAMGGLGFRQLERASMALEERWPAAALRLMRRACEGVDDIGSRLQTYTPPPRAAWHQAWSDAALMREALEDEPG